MKKIILFFLFVSNLLFSEDCGWEWNNPLPQGNMLTYVKFASKEVIYIFGSNATIIKSTDSGVSWKLIDAGVFEYSNSYIIDENNLLLKLESNNNRFLKTSDGGETWSEYIINVEMLGKGSFHFFNTNDLIYYSDTLIQKTTDGGNIWENIAVPIKPFKKFSSIDLNTYFISDNKQLFKTTDSGLNWSANDLPDSSFYSIIYFINQNNGFVCSFPNLFYRTTDAGETWKKINLNLNTPIFYMKFFDENTGYIFGMGFLYKTTDGGDNWEKQFSGSSFDSDIISVDFYEDGFLIGVGGFGNIKRTTDFGNTWENAKTGTNNDIKDITFTDENTGFAIGQYGTILKTTNAGKNWEDKSYSDKEVVFSKIKFFNKDSAIIASADGKFYRTTNEGEEWNKTGEIYDISLKDISFINEQIGWACYWGSTKEYYVSKTTEGGSYWQTQKFLKDTIIEDIQFLDESTGFAVGRKGVFWTITNSGEDWQTIQLDTNISLNCMYFIDVNTGWIAGSQILKTTDGGNTWNLQLDSLNIYFNSIQFVNSNIGWAVSSKGHIYKTIDGGACWEFEAKLTDNWIYKILFLDEKNGWIVGNYGTILKYSCTETSIEEHLPISEHNDFQIFPNPSTNQISLSFPEEQNINSISIFNSLGIEVKRIEQTEIIGNSKITISVADLPVGLYHCSFVNQAGRITKSFVVVR